ncbi:hypothetical protein GB883_20975, partial [Georgenia thermotolerans]
MAAMSPAGPLTTALYEVHAAARAALTPHAGWLVAARYTDPAEERAALRERAGLVDLSHTGQVEVSGPDAAATVAGGLVLPAGVPEVGGTAPAGLPGAGNPAPAGPAPADTGDLAVHRLAPTEFLVLTGTGDRIAVLDALLLASHRAGAERVLVADRTEARVLLGLAGPAAPDVLRAAAGAAPAVGACVPAVVAGAPVLLARPAEGLLTLGGPAASAAALWHALLAA